MRRALLLLAIAMLLPMAMSAQLLPSGKLKMQHSPYSLKSPSTRLMTPARANLADNQKIMGHYDTDDITTDGLGITGLPGVIPISTILTPDELALFQGGQIVKFRVGLAAATAVTRVFVAPVSATGSVGATTEWTCNVNAQGWNEIELSTPYSINLSEGQSLMIGFDYTQTSSNYPISAVEVGDIYPSYIYYQGQWQDVGLSDYGNLSVQCVVESDNYPDYLIGVSNLYVPNFIKQGEDLNYIFASRNLGISTTEVAVNACTYDVFVDGELVATTSNATALGNSDVDLYGAIPTADLAVGKHTLTIAVNSLNGEPVERSISTSKEFAVYITGFDHQMHLVEQFTSTYCTYCPLGSSMLEILTSLRDDIIWVGIHGNMNGTDPMRTLQCDTIMSYQGGDSFPSASFDRSTGWESNSTIISSIGYYEQYHQQIAEELSSFFDYLEQSPSFATVNINSTYDADTRNAVITIDGELTSGFEQIMGDDCKLTVYITEDGVTARQLNSGTWVNNYVHNGVMRKALYSVNGNDLNCQGDTYKNEFTITIPSTWNADNLNVVAFISRPLENGAYGNYADMYINQANKRKLGEFDEPTALRGDVNADGLVTIEDVTSLIDCLLKNTTPAGEGADCNLDDQISIEDVTMLIDYLLNGTWPE